jgi:hypothetical protein
MAPDDLLLFSLAFAIIAMMPLRHCRHFAAA